MNEALIVLVSKPFIFELSGVYTKQQLKDYILEFPNAFFQDDCQVYNNSNGTAIRYGSNSDRWTWRLPPVSFSFTCPAPKKIKIKGRYDDSGKSLFGAGFEFSGDKNYVPIFMFDGSSMAVISGGICINTFRESIPLNDWGTLVVNMDAKAFPFEYTWVNDGFIPNGTYTFSWCFDATMINGEYITVTPNPTYFEYFIIEF